MKWYKVKVIFSDCVFFDEISGVDETEALKNAFQNWSDSSLVDIKIL